MGKDKEANKPASTKYLSIFVALIAAFFAFSFGGNTVTTILEAASFVVSMFAFLLIGEKFEGGKLKGFFINSIPLIVFAIFISFNRFYTSSFSDAANGLLSFVGIVGMYFLGYITRFFKELTVKRATLAILLGFGLFGLINTVATLIGYGPFYASIHQGEVYYYDGAIFPIDREMFYLSGFSLVKVSQLFGELSSFLSACALPAILFLKNEKHEGEKDNSTPIKWFKSNEDAIYLVALCAIGAIGLLSMALIPFTYGLILWVVVALISVIIRFVRIEKKAWSIVGYSLLGLLVLYLVLLFVHALTGALDIPPFTYGPIGDVASAIQSVFKNDNKAAIIFGANIADFFGSSSQMVGYIRLHTFEFEALVQGGLFAFLGLAVFMAMSVVSVHRFLREEERIPMEKALVASLVIGFVLYKTVLVDTVPYVNSNVYISTLVHNAPTLAIVYLLGLAYRPVLTKEVKE